MGWGMWSSGYRLGAEDWEPPAEPEGHPLGTRLAFGSSEDLLRLQRPACGQGTELWLDMLLSFCCPRAKARCWLAGEKNKNQRLCISAAHVRDMLYFPSRDGQDMHLDLVKVSRLWFGNCVISHFSTSEGDLGH